MRNIKYLLTIIFVICVSCGVKDGSEKMNYFNSASFQKTYLEKGRKISEQSFTVLKTQLMNSIRMGGIEGALKYCSSEAIPLTDSLSKVFESSIKRTSLKWRNPNNQPTEMERAILEYFGSRHARGVMINDSLIGLQDDIVLYVKPIFVQEMCQNCHGTVGGSITESNYDIIKKLYPDDKAVDYKSGDLRGMWSIRLNVNKSQ